MIPGAGMTAFKSWFSAYIAWVLRANADRILSECSKAGTTVANVETARLLRFAVPIAPPAEQRRIVAAIEEQLSRLDAASVSIRHTRRLSSRLRAAIFQASLDGDWPIRRLGDIAEIGSGATPLRGRSDYWIGGDVPWVTSGQLTRPFVEEETSYITRKALRETNCRLWPRWLIGNSRRRSWVPDSRDRS